jgi:hypothetical protein
MRKILFLTAERAFKDARMQIHEVFAFASRPKYGQLGVKLKKKAVCRAVKMFGLLPGL